MIELFPAGMDRMEASTGKKTKAVPVDQSSYSTGALKIDLWINSDIAYKAFLYLQLYR